MSCSEEGSESGEKLGNLLPVPLEMFCWGNTANGELGLGGIEDNHILIPREHTFKEVDQVKYVACGKSHTVLVTNSGSVFSCGSNDYGQLGHGKQQKRLEKVDGLDAYKVRTVACGEFHTLAVNEWGQVFSWGSSKYGQLGHGDQDEFQKPKIIRALATSFVVQVSSGYKHCLALTNNGQLYTWGCNSSGQLGLGHKCESVSQPTVVKSLGGVPLAFIASGGSHSFAVSKSGAVFGWGKNTFGQLGLNSEVDSYFPAQLKTLRSIRVKYIACGEDFSVFLTQDGGVFTCGAGQYGQLGHGSTSNEILPRKVLELMGTTVTQVSCGRRHTLALVPSRGRIYAFGLGCAGQLGTKALLNSATPQVVVGPWLSPSSVSILENNNISDYVVKRIYAGGDQCFVTVTRLKEQALSNKKLSLKLISPSPKRAKLEQCHPYWDQNKSTRINAVAICYSVTLFSAIDVLQYFVHNLAFGFRNSVVKKIAKDKVAPEDLRVLDESSQILTLRPDKLTACQKQPVNSPVDQDLLTYLETVLSNWACLNASFLLKKDAHYCCTSRHHGINLKEANDCFHTISRIENETLKDLIKDSFLGNILLQMAVPSPPDVETLRVFITVPLYHEFNNTKNCDKLQTPFASAVLALRPEAARVVGLWYVMMSSEYFERLIIVYKSIILRFIQGHTKVDSTNIYWYEGMVTALELLAKLNRLNQSDMGAAGSAGAGGLKVPYDTFHLSELSDHVDISLDYIKWVMEDGHRNTGRKYFCNYPFLFDPQAKTSLLQTDQALQIMEAYCSSTESYMCVACGKSFLRKDHMQRHVSSIHRKIKFYCEICGATLSRRDKLRRHYKTVHKSQGVVIEEIEEEPLLALLAAPPAGKPTAPQADCFTALGSSDFSGTAAAAEEEAAGAAAAEEEEAAAGAAAAEEEAAAGAAAVEEEEAAAGAAALAEEAAAGAAAAEEEAAAGAAAVEEEEAAAGAAAFDITAAGAAAAVGAATNTKKN